MGRFFLNTDFSIMPPLLGQLENTERSVYYWCICQDHRNQCAFYSICQKNIPQNRLTW